MNEALFWNNNGFPSASEIAVWPDMAMRWVFLSSHQTVAQGETCGREEESQTVHADYGRSTYIRWLATQGETSSI